MSTLNQACAALADMLRGEAPVGRRGPREVEKIWLSSPAVFQLRLALNKATQTTLSDAAFREEARTRAVDSANPDTSGPWPLDPTTDLTVDALIKLGQDLGLPPDSDFRPILRTQLTNFNPPGWPPGGRDECYDLALAGVVDTWIDSDKEAGGVSLHMAGQDSRRRMETERAASDLCITKWKEAIDSGRSLIAGVNEPEEPDVIDPILQAVTDHFLAISGYESIDDKIVSLVAIDNAVGNTAEVKFNIDPGGSVQKDANGKVLRDHNGAELRDPPGGAITKPKEPWRPQTYLRREYQLSELRFVSAFPYRGTRITQPGGAWLNWEERTKSR